MNYKWHTRISLGLVTAATIVLLCHGTYPQQEVALFWMMGYFNTVFASPDIDHPNSTPTRNMGAVGKVTSKKFKHRGLLHNPFFWTILYVAIGALVQLEFYYEMWWIAGGLIAIYTHVVLDKCSTKMKRIRTKIKRMLHL